MDRAQFIKILFDNKINVPFNMCCRQIGKFARAKVLVGCKLTENFPHTSYTIERKGSS